ncbi:MAG: M20/M25/M40 family metallo-hydrolase [Planctomycetes bacterium]|nr:M20/M25/M40 family metallo-hydrolase [Planctomycetota bacterium]
MSLLPKLRHTLVLSLLASVVPAQTAVEASAPAPLVDDDLVARIKHEGLENSRVMAYLDHLTNSIGHRLTGSRNFTLACEWAKGEFEKMGLEVQLEEWATWPIGWDRGQWQGRVIEPVAMDLQIATPAFTAPTKGRQRGPMFLAPSTTEEFEAIRDRLEGAFLFRDGERTAEELDAYLAEHSIAGWVKASSGSEEYPNRIRVFADRNRPRDAERLPTIPDIVVRKDQADRIQALLDEHGEIEVEFDIRNRWNTEGVTLHNVIAEIPGTTKPEEVVVVCGHLDSWHQATGTTDNGTGTTTTMEAARILAAVGAKPERTIRFCLWGGEEQGLLGSREHVTRRRTSMKSVQIVFNHDTGTNWAQSLTVNDAAFEPMERVVAPLLTLTPPDPDFEGPVFELKSRPTIAARGGSDHASFLAARVPAFGWGLKGRVDYFGYTWHSQWDTFDVAVPEYQRHTATVVALSALGAANLPERLSSEGVGESGDAGPGSIRLVDSMGASWGVKFGGKRNLDLVEVNADGKAASAGLAAGDRIVAVDGNAIRGLVSLRYALRELEAENATITVERGGEKVVIEAPAAVLKITKPDASKE